MDDDDDDAWMGRDETRRTDDETMKR